MTQETAIEMYVGGLMLDPNTQAPVVILKDESGDLVLPIWIGLAEATSIASIIKQVTMTRPLTHDLIRDILTEVGAKLERVMITELKDSTYYAEVVLSMGEKALVFDSRPSDAIAMALRASAPIYVATKVLEQAKEAFSSGHRGGHGKVPTGNDDAVSEKPGEGSGQETEGPVPEDDPTGDFTNISRDKWSEILNSLDPEDFKYKQ